MNIASVCYNVLKKSESKKNNSKNSFKWEAVKNSFSKNIFFRGEGKYGSKDWTIL